MKTRNFIIYGICLALGFLCHACQPAHAAIVYASWVEPTNAIAAGCKNYTITAQSMDGAKQQWLAAPPLGSTNTTFEGAVAEVKLGLPCMVAIRSESTNGTSTVYGTWVVLYPPTTNSIPPMLLPPGGFGIHY